MGSYTVLLDQSFAFGPFLILELFPILSHSFIAFQIVHNLARALDTDASLAILEERSRHVQINDESLCDSCHARLGTKLFAMYPDDTIVCYKVGNVDLYSFYDFFLFLESQ